MQNPSEDNSKTTPFSSVATQAQLLDKNPTEPADSSQSKASPSSYDEIFALLQDKKNPAEPVDVDPTQPEASPEELKIETEIQEGTKELLDVLQMTWPPPALSIVTDIKIQENTPYQLFLDTSKSHPHSLLIIANSQTNHESFNSKINTLASHLRNVYLAQFFPEHDVDSFRDKPFAQYVTKIELNEYNLDTILTMILPPDSEHRSYLESYRKELTARKSIPHKECKQILFDSLSSQKIIISNDLAHLLESLEQGNVTIGFVEHKIDMASLESQEALERERETLLEYYISIDRVDFQILCTAQLNRFELIKRLNDTNKIIIRLNMNKRIDYSGFAKAQYLTEVEKQYATLKESPAMKQIDKTLDYANQLTAEHSRFCNDFLRMYYQSKIRNKKADEIFVTLNMCRGYNENTSIHQPINTPHNKCHIGYLLNDPMRLSDLQVQLNKLLENIMPAPRYLAESILEKMGFYANGNHYENHKAGLQVNPAWEYGLCIQAADQQLIAFYKNHRCKEIIDGIAGFVSLPLVNLALFYLLDFISTAEKNVQYFQALQIAANLIKKYDLIVPSPYRQQLFSSGHFSDAEKEQLEQRYISKYQEELNKAKHASRALGWEHAINQEVVVCSSSMYKKEANSKSEQLKNPPVPCFQPTSLIVTPK